MSSDLPRDGYWRALAERLLMADFDEDLVRAVLEIYREVEPIDFVSQVPEALASFVTQAVAASGIVSAAFAMAHEDARDLLGIARSVLTEGREANDVETPRTPRPRGAGDPESGLHSPSEYDTLLDQLRQMGIFQTPADLSDEQIETVARAVPAERGSLARIREAERLARETGIPTRAAYALAFDSGEFSAEHLLDVEPTAILDRVTEATRAGAISSLQPEEIDRLLGSVEALQLRNGRLVDRLLTLLLVTGEDRHPLRHGRVRIADRDALPEPREVVTQKTDGRGRITLKFLSPAAGEKTRSFELRLLDDGGETIHREEIGIGPAESGTVTVTVPAAVPEAVRIESLADRLLERLSPAAAETLARGGIHSLADIRARGGLQDLGNGQLDSASIRELEAHASLDPIVTDAALRSFLIGEGFSHPLQIAAASRRSFARAVAERVSERDANLMHLAARTGTALLKTRIAEKRAYKALPKASIDGSAGMGGAATAESAKEGKTPEFEEESASCTCEACSNAASPRAYLTDLLDYALAYLKRTPGGEDVSLDDLARWFHVGFGALANTCESAETRIRQLRLVIEVLRRATATLGGGTVQGYLRSFERRYRDQAYETALSHLGTSYAELRLARGYSPEERDALAARLGFRRMDGNADRLDSLRLDPSGGPQPGPRNEAKLGQLFGLAPTEPTVAAPAASLPDVVHWRLEYLKELWVRQDHGLDAPQWAGPLIEPDLVGPDDFRSESSIAGTPFRAWRDRRAQVDARLALIRAEAPDVAEMLKAAFGTPGPDLPALATQLAADPAAAAGAIRAATGLESDAFQRLVALHEVAASDPQGAPTEVWSELAELLTAGVKEKSFYATWRTEEAQAGWRLDGTLFWPPLRSPVTGDWPPIGAETRILVDPDVDPLEDLRDVSFSGRPVAAVWGDRATELEALGATLREHAAQGELIAMVRAAAAPGEPEASVAADLASAAAGPSAAAAQALVQKYHLPLPALQALAALAARANPSSPPGVYPTTREWDDASDLLRGAYKERRGWRGAQQGISYWGVLRAKLPPWRAPAARRRMWAAALELNVRQPIADPDLVDSEDLATTAGANPASAMLATRRAELDAILAQMATARQSAPDLSSWLGGQLQAHLGIGAADLQALAQKQTTTPIAGRLAQLSLPHAAFVRLLELQRQIANGPALDGGEVAEIENILSGVVKRRWFGRWNAEESTAGLSLDPDLFRLRPPGPLPSLTLWRVDRVTRREWSNKLEGRIVQRETVHNGVRAAVDAAEEAALPTLRDGLVYAAYMQAHPVSDTMMTGQHAPDQNVELRVRWATRAFLIDVAISPCRMTTRVQQAIETMQTLLWGTRAGILEPATALEIAASHFDRDWRWLGTYPAWRAAMLVFLYPEALLLPTLRRDATPGFTELADALAGLNPVTAEGAQVAVERYSSYFADVCGMRVEAVASMSLGTGGEAFLVFGRGASTGTVYYGVIEPGTELPTHWRPVPGMSTVGATRIVGVSRQQTTAGEWRIHLFVKGIDAGSAALWVQSYKITVDAAVHGEWASDEATALDAPIDGAWDALVVLNNGPNLPAGVLFWGPAGMAVRHLEADGSAWRSEGSDKLADFASFTDHEGVAQPMSRLLPLTLVQHWYNPREQNTFAFVLLAVDPERAENERLIAVHVGNSTTGYGIQKGAGWQLSGKDAWLGAVYFSATKHLVGFRVTSPTRVRFLSLKLNFGTLDVVANPTTGSFYSGYIPLDVRWATTHAASGGSAHVGHLWDSEPNANATPYLNSLTVASDGTPSWGPPDALGGVQLAPRTVPHLPTPGDLDPDHWWHRDRVRRLCELNEESPTRIRDLIAEAFYYAPMQVALQLQRSGKFVDALDWYRRVYDHSRWSADRFLYRPIAPGGQPADPSWERLSSWWSDPLDVHAIAGTRPHTDARFVLLSLVQCLIEYGDSEFATDTPDSVARARELYLQALRLLEDPLLQETTSACDEILTGVRISPAEWQAGGGALVIEMRRFASPTILAETTAALRQILDGREPLPERMALAKELVAGALSRDAKRPRPTFRETLKRDRAHFEKVAWALEAENKDRGAFLLALGAAPNGTRQKGAAVERRRQSLASKLLDGSRRLVDFDFPITWIGEVDLGEIVFPSPKHTFCIPPNPRLRALRMHAGLNLYKLRTCRNIAGMERELEPYAPSGTDMLDFPSIGADGTLNIPGAVTLQPTAYRYRTLAERAKQLVSIAQQIESSFLQYQEKADAERYGVLRARQDLGIARAGVRLKELHLREAQHGVTFAALQQERALLQEEYYAELIAAGPLWQEQAALWLLVASAGFQFGVAVLKTGAAIAAGVAAGTAAYGQGAGVGGVAGAVVSAVADPTGQVLSAVAGGLSTTSSAFTMAASFERRREEWEFQRALSEHDQRIGGQQVTLANDRVRIVGQEHEIAEMQVDHADDVSSFLQSKFTNFELYEWMSGVTQGVYRYFLQQATAVSRLAEAQLAFERQEIPPAFIQTDYWAAPSGGGGASHDRRGLTGSARLLQDLYRLDQYAFDTDRRKLQLTKTFSLARLDPVAFQRFVESGVAAFTTPMEMFDRDFPGHYLRLIRRVRTSVVALVPPVEGIRATLSTTGISRVVIGGSGFETRVLNRGVESVALSAPMNATGLFELEPQGNPEMLLPFEGLGVDATWELRMPKASNPLDYRTVVDVLVTVEYTAFDSPIYRREVISRLDPRVRADRPFSFRHQFADAWYDLHNPALSDTPMTVRFVTGRSDFGPNLDEIRVEHVTCYFVRKAGATSEVEIERLLLTDGAGSEAGGPATTLGGMASTRGSSATTWTTMIGKPPFGTWELALRDTPDLRERFGTGDIEDIVLVLSFSGRTPEWPG